MKVSLISLKMVGLSFATSLFLLFIGYQMGGRWGLLGALCFAIAWLILQFISDESRWIEDTEGKHLRGQDPWGLIKHMEEIASRLHTDPPNVVLTPHRSAYAFAIDHGVAKETILVSRGALDHLDSNELDALLTAEVCSLTLRKRLRYRWVHRMALCAAHLFEVLESVLPGQRRWGLSRTLGAFFSAAILRLGFWSRFEEEREELTTSLLKDRRTLGLAMVKLTSLGQTFPFDPPLGSRHLFLVDPGRTEGEGVLLNLHTPLPRRLRRILGAEFV